MWPKVTVAGDSGMMRVPLENPPMLRRVRLFVATSLDGYIAGPGDALDWLFTDDDYGYDAFIAGVDTLAMGRRTFETVLAQVGSIVSLSNEYIGDVTDTGFFCKRTRVPRTQTPLPDLDLDTFPPIAPSFRPLSQAFPNRCRNVRTQQTASPSARATSSSCACATSTRPSRTGLSLSSARVRHRATPRHPALPVDP